MPVTIIGEPLGSPFPLPFTAPIVSSKNNWIDDWDFEPDLDVVSFTACASSTQASEAQVSTRYGNVKKTFDDDFDVLTRADWIGAWIKISLSGPHGDMRQFVGIVESASVIMTGGLDSDGNSLPSGRQLFVAAGGLKILQKIVVSGSVFLNDDGSTSNVEWIPAMNQKDKRGLLVGNRSNAPPTDDQSYFYGGTNIWTHLQYVEYLVDNFIQQVDEDDNNIGPIWTVGGQTSVLGTMKTSIKFSEAASAADMLRELIPVRYGLDFYVQPTDAGFAITIFSLTSDPAATNGNAGLVNPSQVKIIKNNEPDLIQCHVVDSKERTVDTIQVMGKRIVVCGSLFGPEAGDRSHGITLVPKWSAGIEADYFLPLGTTDTSTYDDVRKNERYRDVYQHFGAPKDWDMDGGVWAVACAADGSLITDEFQTSIRETLSWIPLKEGFDYSTDPPTDNTLGDQESSDVKPPMAFINDPTPDEGAARYVLAHQAGIHVHKPYMDWGIVLDATPNHLLALNHFNDGGATTDTDPHYDYDTAIATIAIESDFRLLLSYTVPQASAAGDGSVMTILDNEAECWVMLPGTVVDCDANGNLATSGSAQRVLRSDTDRLALVLAGAVSKYQNDRVRAQLTFRGFQPWSSLIGNILTIIQEGDDVQSVGAPITSIEWSMSKDPTMVLRTGYA